MKSLLYFCNRRIIIILTTSLIFNCLGIIEIDSERSWCYEKIYHDDGIYDPTVSLVFCQNRDRKTDETQEAYNAYLNANSEKCIFAILSFHIYRKRFEKCGNINNLRPIVHEPTAIIRPSNY